MLADAVNSNLGGLIVRKDYKRRGMTAGSDDLRPITGGDCLNHSPSDSATILALEQL